MGSGAWLTQSQDYQYVPYQQAIDPQHLNPDPNPDFAGTTPVWANNSPAPDLPSALLPGQTVDVLPTGVGPVSYDPLNPAIGVGVGHGLSDEEAMDNAARWQMKDDGSYGAHRWLPVRDRAGEYSVDRMDSNPELGDSPQTVALERTGVGHANDPEARLGWRVWRSWAEKIDFHRWAVSFRPVEPKFARTTPVHQVAYANQYTPHTPSAVGWNPGSPDKFVAPMTRRSPGQWDEPLVTDGTIRTIVGATYSYGLTQQGL
jgi:hypothetical protein